MKKFACALGLAALIATSAHAADKQDAAAAINEAVSLNQQAHEAGFEWRDTYKALIGPAKEAYRKGDYDKAQALAETAKSHAKLGLQQAEQAAKVQPNL